MKIINKEAVIRSFNFTMKLTVLRTTGLPLDDLQRYEILSKPCRTPLETISLFLPHHTAHSYKHTVIDKHKKTPPRKKVITITFSSLTLEPIPEEEAEFPSLREYEDELLKRAIKKDADDQNEKFTLISTKKNLISKQLIQNMQPLLHPTVGEFFDLSLLFDKFQGVSGFQAKIEDIIETYHPASCIPHEIRSRRGILFELNYADQLTSTDTIIGFSSTFASPSTKTKAEYDLETASNMLIECKLADNSFEGKESQIVVKRNIARELGKQFIVSVGTELSEDRKQWLNKQGIAFKENQLSLRPQSNTGNANP